MKTKHVKAMEIPNHFEKKSRNDVHFGEHTSAYINGYNEALEKTNAKELLNTLIKVYKSKIETGKIDSEHVLLMINAITKATE